MNIVGTQGTKNPRTVYEFVYEGIKRRVAVTIGSNGFVDAETICRGNLVIIK